MDLCYVLNLNSIDCERTSVPNSKFTIVLSRQFLAIDRDSLYFVLDSVRVCKCQRASEYRIGVTGATTFKKLLPRNGLWELVCIVESLSTGDFSPI